MEHDKIENAIEIADNILQEDLTEEARIGLLQIKLKLESALQNPDMTPGAVKALLKELISWLVIFFPLIVEIIKLWI